MTESAIQKKIIAWLKDQGFLTWKISDRFRSGIPDLYCCKDGESFWLEIKRPAGRVTKLQEYELEQLREHDVPAYVVTSPEQVQVIMRNAGVVA